MFNTNLRLGEKSIRRDCDVKNIVGDRKNWMSSFIINAVPKRTPYRDVLVILILL